MPNPIDDEELYRCIVTGSKKSPGQVTLSGHDRGEKWNVKEGDGEGGATTEHKGEEVTRFKASFYLVKDPVLGINEYAEMDEYVRYLKTLLVKPLKAVDVYHPDLAENDIKSVQLAKVGGRTYDGKGGATQFVEFLEYRPAKPKGGKPNGSTPGSPDPAAPPDPNADAKQAIKELTDEAKAA